MIRVNTSKDEQVTLLTPLLLWFMKTFRAVSTRKPESTAEPNFPQCQFLSTRFCFRLLSLDQQNRN